MSRSRFKRPRAPAAHAVQAHWATRLSRPTWGKADAFTGGMYCFACQFGWDRLEMAHIVPHRCGGSSGVENLHLLCQVCHVDSETLTGFAYWRWLRAQTLNRVLKLLDGREAYRE